MFLVAKVSKKVAEQKATAEKAWKRWEEVFSNELSIDEKRYGVNLFRDLIAIKVYCKFCLEILRKNKKGDDLCHLFEMIESDFCLRINCGEGVTWPTFRESLESLIEQPVSFESGALSKIESLETSMKAYIEECEGLLAFTGKTIGEYAVKLNLLMSHLYMLVALTLEERMALGCM